MNEHHAVPPAKRTFQKRPTLKVRAPSPLLVLPPEELPPLRSKPESRVAGLDRSEARGVEPPRCDRGAQQRGQPIMGDGTDGPHEVDE